MNKARKNILIVDTNYAVLPLIELLLSKGYMVTVVGTYCSDAVLSKKIKYCKVNYGCITELQSFIHANRFDYIIPGCTDLSYLQCSILSVAGCESYENINILHDKKKLKKKFIKYGFEVASEDTGATDSTSDYIVKPVDSFSGRGISRLEKGFTQSEKIKAVQFAKEESKSNEAIIEQFILGNLYSVSVYWTGSFLSNLVFVREECLSDNFRVDISYVVNPESEGINEGHIKSRITALASGMNLVRGMIHFQFILRDGKAYFLECMRRLPGDLYSRLIELSLGWKYHCSYLSPFLNGPINESSSAERIRKSFIRLSVSTEEKNRKIESLIRYHNVKYEKYSQNKASQFIRSTYMIPISRKSAPAAEITNILSM